MAPLSRRRLQWLVKPDWCGLRLWQYPGMGTNLRKNWERFNGPGPMFYGILLGFWELRIWRATRKEDGTP